MRRTDLVAIIAEHDDGIISAHAENRRTRLMQKILNRDHLRACGEQ